MKLLRIIGSVDPASGGPIEAILTLDRSLGDALHTELVSLDAPDAPFLEHLPVTTHALGSRPFAAGPKGRLAAFGYTPALVPWLKRNIGRFDCAIVDGFWNYGSVGAARVLPGGEVPYFVFAHGMLDPWFRRTFPRKHRLKQLFWLPWDGRLAAGAEAVLFTAEDEKRGAEGQFFGHRFRSRVVPLGIPAHEGDPAQEIEAFRSAVPALGGRPFLLFIGRIHPKKGCDDLIRAFARIAPAHPGLDLVMAGPDQLGWAASLQAEAAALGCGARVHWTGLLRGPAKWGAFRAAEAFVLPSHQENFGIAVAEALSVGLPVLISTRVNIWREIVAAGAGLACADEAAATAVQLGAFLAMLPADRDAMRKAARRCFHQTFDTAVTAQHFLSVIAQPGGARTRGTGSMVLAG